MKKQIIIASALLVSTFSFSQKDELKAAEKAIKNSNYAEAKSAIKDAEPLISNADEKLKAKFYYLKGQALYANGAGSSTDTDAAIESLNMVAQVEGEKGKYADDVAVLKQSMLSSFLTKANAALESKNFAISSNGFEKAYRMSVKDTLYLYYAAATAVNGQDYDTALKYYKELKDLGFKGIETQYYATIKDTGEEEMFTSKALRDISVKTGTHILPKQKITDSKEAEIVKNIALIYVNKGENEKAIEAMKDARKANPDDLNLIINEANLQLKMGNKDIFKSLIQEALVKDPNNPELLFNLGIVAADAGEIEAARDYYERAIKIKPDYADVYNNMAVLILGGEQKIIKEMNSLGNSTADNKKYDELKASINQLYRDAIPYLESTLRLRSKDIQAAKTLMNIYSSLGETAKFKEMKAKVQAIEAGN